MDNAGTPTYVVFGIMKPNRGRAEMERLVQGGCFSCEHKR
jgi:hypothetical protein